MLGLGLIAIAIIALPIPYIFKWDWEAKYFGAMMFSTASGSIMGVYPILCIVQYSVLPMPARLCVAILSTVSVIIWCSRLVRTYKTIYEDKRLLGCIYEEEPTAVYYLQQGDRAISERLFHVQLFPSSKSTFFCFFAAFFLIPFAPSVVTFVGLPFTHVFLAVFAAPLDLMFIGIATKMWLVYYFYPNKIRRITNKPVYVDMSSQPHRPISPIT
jgi:hypothetical protein